MSDTTRGKLRLTCAASFMICNILIVLFSHLEILPIAIAIIVMFVLCGVTGIALLYDRLFL